MHRNIALHAWRLRMILVEIYSFGLAQMTDIKCKVIGNSQALSTFHPAKQKCINKSITLVR